MRKNTLYKSTYLVNCLCNHSDQVTFIHDSSTSNEHQIFEYEKSHICKKCLSRILNISVKCKRISDIVKTNKVLIKIKDSLYELKDNLSLSCVNHDYNTENNYISINLNDIIIMIEK